MAKAEKPKTLNRNRGEAAYVLVDLDALDPETAADIVADAAEGAGTYGIRVVEISINGPAQAPIYGYYKDSPDAEKWAAAKAELGIDEAVEHPDANKLRESAAANAAEAATRQNKADEAEVEAIAGKSK